MDDTEDPTGRSLYDQETPGDPEGAPSAAVEGDEPDPMGDEAVEAMPVLGGATAPPAWVGILSGAGLGLAVVQGLLLLGTVAQGMAIKRFDGDLFHKVGFAFVSQVESANGVMLLVAAVLAGLPSLLGMSSTPAQRRRRALTFGLVTVLAVVIIIGTPLAVRARVRVIDLSRQSVGVLDRRFLATYVAGTLGAALVALGTALGLARLDPDEAAEA